MKTAIALSAVLFAAASLPAFGHDAHRNDWDRRDDRRSPSYRVEHGYAQGRTDFRRNGHWHRPHHAHYHGTRYVVHYGACDDYYKWVGGALLFSEILHHSHGYR